MKTSKQKILELYKNKILAIRNYNSNEREFRVKDFTDLVKLEEIILEIFTGESDITPAGKQFLISYYTLDYLADHLFNSVNVKKRYNLENKKQTEKILSELVPMETITFVEEARDNTIQGKALRDDLLPPIE